MMLDIILIACALAMDCFTVSVVAGVIVRKKDVPLMLRLAILFGFFQALMPFIGWLLTYRFSSLLENIDHWIAFGLLLFIGGKMIFDAFSDDETQSFDPRHLKTQLALAVATSIDALAIGISFACSGYTTFRQIELPLAVIGLASFLFSVCGYLIGVRFGSAVTKRIKPELLGGLILIAIGIKILVEHLSA